ncbi:MAG: heme peroxidase family protein [Blastocatellia bacterium]
MSNETTTPANASQTTATPRPKFHGLLRGLDSTPSSPQFEGRFGRMFRTLPAAKFFVEDLDALSEEMVAEAEEEPTSENDPEGDDEESRNIASGFTYLGQFIDHDLTFDPISSLEKQNDPDSLTDFRTPRFDLDSVYGRGPSDQPYLYEDDGRHFRLGRRLTGAERFDKNVRDLPRHKSETSRARALIGDPRNDENVIVAQLHAAMLRFHNSMADLCGPNESFDEIQRQVRWHYQWVVLQDFLPKIVGQDMVFSILPHLKTKKPITESKPDLRVYKWRNDPFIPVEFSVAAYRFGHSMIRPQYRLNTTMTTGGPEGNGRLPIFTSADGNESLNGFREFPSTFAIDWSLFFDMGDKPPKFGPTRLQPAYKIDSSLVDPLGGLPPSTASSPSSLAKRNLLRSLRLGLPSGQAVAKQMGLTPIPDDKLRVGKATKDDADENLSITEFGDSFKKNAPLWFYILAEAQQQFKNDDSPIVLGPVGGRIVAEVFIGLMLGDSHSFLRQSPGWTPNPAMTKKDGTFGIAELIKQAIKV